MRVFVSSLIILLGTSLAAAQTGVKDTSAIHKTEIQDIDLTSKKSSDTKSQKLNHSQTSSEKLDPVWFSCKSFSDCVKLTGNICGNAKAVNKKYQDHFLDYVAQKKKRGKCPPLSDKQVMKDMKKLPGCIKNKCKLVFPQ